MADENKVSLSHTNRTSRLGAVRPVKIPYVLYVGFQGEPHFLSTVRLFSDS
jgi:hypothetical protein